MSLAFRCLTPQAPSQSPDEDSLSSDQISAKRVTEEGEIELSQSPDEDSLSSDLIFLGFLVVWRGGCLNPLTRIHCLPTLYLNAGASSNYLSWSQSPDEDSLSSDASATSVNCVPQSAESQSPDEDSLSSDFNQVARIRTW